MAETINIRIPDQLNLGQYEINIGDTVEFIEKMTGTQTDLDIFSTQSNTMGQDVQLAANQIGVRWTEILAAGLQVDTDKGIVTQLRADTNADKILAEQAAVDAGGSASSAHDDSVLAQNAATATNADKIQTGLDRIAAAESSALSSGYSTEAENFKNQASGFAEDAEIAESNAAEWAQLILEAGIGGFATLTYEQRGALRSLNPNDVVQTLVTGLGLFSYDATSDLLDDDMTYFKAAVGGWKMSVPATDTVTAIIDAIARQEITDKIVTGEAYCDIASIAAVSSVSFTAAIFGIEVGASVIVTPPAELPKISIIGRAAGYNQVTITLTNASASAATIPAEAKGSENPWTITVIKKGDKL